MLIVCNVATEFKNRANQVIYTVPPEKLLEMLEAPEEIQEDPYFHMLLADGKLKAVQTVEQRRQLEADPTAAPAAADAAADAPAPEAAPEAAPAAPKAARKAKQ